MLEPKDRLSWCVCPVKRRSDLQDLDFCSAVYGEGYIE